MACIQPFTIAKKNGELVQVPCRHCVGCTIQKIQDLKVYAQAEKASMTAKGYCSSFIRLSYNDAFLPVMYHGELKRLGELVENGQVPTDFKPTLLKSDFVNFMKRLRQEIDRHYDGRKVKYIYAGEYGEKNSLRSHYHLILFGLSYVEARHLISNVWKYGFCDYRPLKAGAVSYIATYMFHDVFGKERELKYTRYGVEPPFLYHSCNLGKDYLKNYHNDGLVPIGGHKVAFPKYYKKKYSIQPKDFYSQQELEEFKKLALAKAQEYVIRQRQRAIAIDDSSLSTSQSLEKSTTTKLNKLIQEASK